MTISAVKLTLAIAAMLLGTAHMALTPFAYPIWTLDALWFVGSGLAILTGAAANIIGRDAENLSSRVMLGLVNLAMTGFFVAAWLVLPAPQVIVGGLLFAGLAVPYPPQGNAIYPQTGA